MLANYATHDQHAQGRIYPEPEAPGRGPFQRDRDRIIHSSAFRRLEYKTQVFVNHEGDMFRTRLTHTIEVAQIARSIARQLHVNEDLVEAVALAHDLGHTPFGHAGQDALNECMREWGGFEHNLQSLRVVDELEERYGAFDGLNLSYETREGILKHCSLKNARKLGVIGQRFILKQQPSMEAQIANLADEIAYTNHDIDDGLRSGLLDEKYLLEMPLFARHCDEVIKAYPEINTRRRIQEIVRRMINTLVVDLVTETQHRLEIAQPQSLDDVRKAGVLVAFSSSMRVEIDAMKSLLFDELYRHYRVVRMKIKAERVIQSLFESFMQEPKLLPPEHRRRVDQQGTRAIADYIAGMTDRFAIKEYQRVFDVEGI